MISRAHELCDKLLNIYKTQYDKLTKPQRKRIKVQNVPENLPIDLYIENLKMFICSWSINRENGMSNKQSKKNIKKLSAFLAEYVNIKKLFTLPRKPDKCLWAPLCPINLEEMLKF